MNFKLEHGFGMNKFLFGVIFLGLLLGPLANAAETNRHYEREFKKCWSDKHYITLLDTMKRAIATKRLEDYFERHDFIQTFGGAYEEDDIEQNSIRAVLRAVVQSIRNRNIELRDDLTTLLNANPPRPDNLMREYSIYVNIPIENEKKPARYEIKILDLIAVPTIESPMSVWTRIVTRFAYKEDFTHVMKTADIESEFINVMQRSQDILENAEKRKMSKMKDLLRLDRPAESYPKSIHDLRFGDSMYLFSESEIQSSYIGVYLGKGIIACDTPDNGIVVCKFGEERLFGIRVDCNTFRRTVPLFADLDYQAPEVILQCLFLQFTNKKPGSLPPIVVSNDIE